MFQNSTNICSFASLFGWITKNQKIIILPCRNSALKFQFEIEFDSIKKMLLRGCCSEQGPGKVSSIANLTEHDLAAGSVSLWVVRNCGFVAIPTAVTLPEQQTLDLLNQSPTLVVQGKDAHVWKVWFERGTLPFLTIEPSCCKEWCVCRYTNCISLA